MAALIAKQQRLKEMHALEEQEEVIRRKKEQLELDVAVEASMAKVKALKASGGSHASSRASRQASNAMNSYLEREKRNKPLSADARSFVPNNKPSGKPYSSSYVNQKLYSICQ